MKTFYILLVIIICAGYSCNLNSKNQHVSNDKFIILSTDDVKMDSNTLFDITDTFSIKELPVKKTNSQFTLQHATPLTERLFKIALNDIEANYVNHNGRRYLGAGTNFKLKVYTRDIALSGVLSLNELDPDIVLSSLKHTRKLRRKLGFTIQKDEDHFREVIKAPFAVSAFEGKEFIDTFKTNSYMRRTDDVVWLWCAGDLAERYDTNNQLWQWIHEEGNYFFDNFYSFFYDKTDGLYHGQACFVDIGSGYPDKWNSYPEMAECVFIKASSTNALYYQGMKVMKKACLALGLEKEAKEWEIKSGKLLKAFKETFINANGTIDYYMDRNNDLSGRQHVLSTAFPVLFDMLTPNQAKLAFSNYPVNPKGIPLIYPFFDHWRVYHNLSSWPFADTFFLWAKEKATGNDYTALNAFILGRTCGQAYWIKKDKENQQYFFIPKQPEYGRNFQEMVHYESGKFGGSGSQLWTAAAFVNVCIRSGIIDFK